MPWLLRRSTDPTVGLFLVYALYTDRDDIRYVGVTKRGLFQRLREHKDNAAAGVRRPLYDWMRTLASVDDVHIEVLAECSTEDELFEVEPMWIFNTKLAGHRLLNVAEGGRGRTGFHHTDETKMKISQSTKGRPKSDETRRRMSEARRGEGSTWFGKKLSQEHKDRIGEAVRGSGNGFYGRSHSDEVKRRISETKKANPNPVNHVRWHVKRDIIVDTCKWCMDELPRTDGS